MQIMRVDFEFPWKIGGKLMEVSLSAVIQTSGRLAGQRDGRRCGSVHVICPTYCSNGLNRLCEDVGGMESHTLFIVCVKVVVQVMKCSCLITN